MSMYPVIVIPAYQPTHTLVTLIKILQQQRETQEIIVVNDGSRSLCKPIFAELEKMPHVTVLHHEVNQGKGQALKTAFRYFLDHYPQNTLGVVTADADGQHDPEDILALAQKLQDKPDTLFLGSRLFEGKVPLRSRFGNTLTRWVFKFLTGTYLQDTQTGLRALPRAMVQMCLQIRARGYEFELEMLVFAAKNRMPIQEISIKTIYEDNNKSSHFNPLLDSMKIYFVFLRFVEWSIITALLDYAIFMVCMLSGASILTSIIIARLGAGTFNFMCNKNLTFKSRGNIVKEAVKYITLVGTFMFIAYSSITFMVTHWSMNVYVSKIIVEGALFFLSFLIQDRIVFKPAKA